MENNLFCVICATDKPLECFKSVGDHIIAEALGNTEYILKNVCDDCNSKLGGRIDQKLLRNYSIKAFREARKIEGKRKLPKTLNGKFGFDEIGRKYTIHARLDGKYEACLVQGYKGDKPMFNDELCKIHLEDGTSGKFISTFRLRLKDSEEIISLRVFHQASEIIGHLNLEYKVAIMKIAYEFAVLWFGLDYCKDDIAEELRSVLKAYVDIKGKSDEKSVEALADRVLNKHIYPLGHLHESSLIITQFLQDCYQSNYAHEVRAFPMINPNLIGTGVPLEGHTGICVSLDGQIPIAVRVGDLHWVIGSPNQYIAVITGTRGHSGSSPLPD